MGWEDRPYYRDRSSSSMGPLQWLWSGTFPLFTAFGVHVRAHASLAVLAVLVLLFGVGGTISSSVQFVTALFAIVVLHEFGHCFAARWVGGEADEILVTPLGGLAMAYALPPEARGIVLGLEMEYLKKARGTLVAAADFEPPRPAPKQEFTLSVDVRDDAGDVVARGRVRWLLEWRSA